MGLTWTVEILAWSLSGTDEAAPQAVIILLNVLNIFQVTIGAIPFEVGGEGEKRWGTDRFCCRTCRA